MIQQSRNFTLIKEQKINIRGLAYIQSYKSHCSKTKSKKIVSKSELSLSLFVVHKRQRNFSKEREKKNSLLTIFIIFSFFSLGILEKILPLKQDVNYIIFYTLQRVPICSLRIRQSDLILFIKCATESSQSSQDINYL